MSEHPAPDAVEIAGLGAGEEPCIRLVYKLTGTLPADQPPSERMREVEALLAKVLGA